MRKLKCRPEGGELIFEPGSSMFVCGTGDLIKGLAHARQEPA
jgi:hypothetical protein